MKLKRKAAKRKAPAKRKPAALAPRTEPPDPEHGRYRGVFYMQRTAGVIVNEDTAMTQSTVWACIKCIAESLAGMPWRVGRLTQDWTIDPIAHPLDWLLNYAPNDEVDSFTFRETLWAWMLGWGNGYAEIERNGFQEPVALWGIHPSRVTPMRTDSGELVYRVYNEEDDPTYLTKRQMFHLKGFSPDGYVGYSVIRMHARTIGLAIAQETNASSLNENDSTPGGLLTTPQQLTPQALKNLEESWDRRHKGPKNRRTIAILEQDLKWQQTGLDPDDMKLVEQMQLTPAMICRIFRVPPHKIADLTRSTNNNIEHQDLEFVKDTLRPCAERGEGEADLKLFGRNNQARLVTFIDLSERERGDTAAQTQFVKEMTFSGIFNINMALRYLGQRGIGPMGDVRFIQSSMIRLEDAVNGQTNPPTQPSEPESDDEPVAETPTMDEPDEKMARLEVGCMGLITDACRRMLKRENDSKNLKGDAFGQWLFKHREYCREILLPAAGLLSECFSANGEATEVAVSLFLDKHFKEPPGTPESKAAELRSYLLAAAAAKGAA